MRLRSPLTGVLFAALLTPFFVGCGSSCGDGKSLEILAPMNGDAIEGVAVDVTLLACGFERDDEVILYLLDPVETAYSFLRVEDSDELMVTVATLPGEMRLQAGARDEDAIRSQVVAVNVTR